MISEKKSKTEIIKLIVESVSNAPKSMYELGKELNSNWDTIKNNVELLRDLGIVDIVDQKVIKKYECAVSIYDDTVASLPLSNEIRKRIYALAKKISDKWMEVTGKTPNRTQLQKSLVEMAEKFPNLNIPRGWYFYGKVVLVKVDPAKLTGELDKYKYDFKVLSIDLKKFNEEILITVKKISKLKNRELIDEQYSSFKKEDYLIKREIEKLLCENFDKEKFANLLYKLIFNFKIIAGDKLNQRMISIIKEAISIMILKVFKHDMNKEIIFKFQLIETFAAFWKIYATYSLLISLEGDLGYDKRFIKSIFEDRINFYVNDLTDYFNNCDLASA